MVGLQSQRQGLLFKEEIGLVYSLNLEKWEQKVKPFGLA